MKEGSPASDSLVYAAFEVIMIPKVVSFDPKERVAAREAVKARGKIFLLLQVREFILRSDEATIRQEVGRILSASAEVLIVDEGSEHSDEVARVISDTSTIRLANPLHYQMVKSDF